jgi:hypothetical protein
MSNYTTLVLLYLPLFRLSDIRKYSPNSTRPSELPYKFLSILFLDLLSHSFLEQLAAFAVHDDTIKFARRIMDRYLYHLIRFAPLLFLLPPSLPPMISVLHSPLHICYYYQLCIFDRARVEEIKQIVDGLFNIVVFT